MHPQVIRNTVYTKKKQYGSGQKALGEYFKWSTTVSEVLSGTHATTPKVDEFTGTGLRPRWLECLHPTQTDGRQNKERIRSPLVGRPYYHPFFAVAHHR